MKSRRFFLSLLVLLVSGMAVADSKVQKFFNLTADEVRIDSVLPRFSCTLPLDGAWADSVYTATIAYPEFVDMGADDVERYQKITAKPLDEWPHVDANVVVERKRGHLEVSFVPLVMRDGKYRKLVSFMLEVQAQQRPAMKKMAKAGEEILPKDRYADHSILAKGRWAKVRVPSTGIYKIDDALIRKAGFSNLDKVQIYGYGGAMQNEVLQAEDLINLDDLKQVPQCVVNGQRLFHAQGPVSWTTKRTGKRTRNPYADYGYYFITEGEDAPLTVDSATFVSAFYPSYDDYHTLHEIDNFAWYQGGRNLFEDSPVALGATKEYPIDLVCGKNSTGYITITVSAGVASKVKVEINDSVLSTLNITLGQYDHGNSATGTYRVKTLLASNRVKITPTSGGPVRLDYICFSHDDARPEPMLSTTAFAAPEYVYNITNQDHHADGPVDMVIIIPTSQKLLAQAQRLKEYREQHDGLRVRIVPADELFNEFSSGTPDANAYRRYLKMLYDRAETEEDMPSYLLLFGDCVWDNRLNTSDCAGLNADDLLLCHESENSFSATDCYVDDGFFCLLDDGEGGKPDTTDKLDVAVGRLPVRNAYDAQIVVDKLIAYGENKNAGNWQNVMMFMGDDGNENIHMSDADEMANIIESKLPSVVVKRVMWDAYPVEASAGGNTYPEVAKIIKQQQEEGALVMNYSGHGRADQISHERVLRIDDFSSFKNQNLPLWITASCDIMPFDSQQANIGETALLNPNGGAVAFFGTTRTVFIVRNRAINRAFLNMLFTPVDGAYISIGEAQRKAKNYLIESKEDATVNKLQYSLLGDPALKLNLPQHRVLVDSINGVDLATCEHLPMLNAGAVVTVKGHVENVDGGLDDTFNGTVSALVRDAKKEVVCRLNNTSSDGATTSYVFYDRDKTLFSGNNVVANGEFSFTFAVPKDIDYSDESGLINIFAIDEQTAQTVNGNTDRFLVGGSGNLDNDGIGPSIYCYLNSTSFVDGGSVNPSPFFVAQITDKDGLNVSGSGIGHDLQLVIDGRADMTYNLNDNFTYDFGSYTKGSTYYNIPALAEGVHTLQFKAWDIMNNSSSAQLTFQVVAGIKPAYLRVSCSDNPAKEKTTFIVNHDRAGSMIDLEIDVFDLSGRPIWTYTEHGTASQGTCTVDWNLTGSNGSRVQTGVYVYRVRLGSDGSSMISKSQKLVVVRQ